MTAMPELEHIEVTDPDDPMGMPAYGGTSLSDAADFLIPGTYPAYVHYSDGAEGPVRLTIAEDGTPSLAPPEE